MDRKTAIVEILLVEDSKDDVDLMSDALKEGCWNPHITVVDNGEDAVNFLHREGNSLPHPSRTLFCSICRSRA